MYLSLACLVAINEAINKVLQVKMKGEFANNMKPKSVAEEVVVILRNPVAIYSLPLPLMQISRQPFFTFLFFS